MADSAAKQIWIGTVTTVVSAGVLAAIGFVFGFAWLWTPFIWIWEKLKAAGGWLVEPSPMPRWLLGAILIAFLLVLWRIVRTMRRKPESHTELYKADVFHQVIWHWEYVNGQPDSPWCHCPEDGMQLILAPRGAYKAAQHLVLHCEHCKKDYTGEDQAGWRVDDDTERAIRDQIVRKIQRKISTGEWKTVKVPQFGASRQEVKEKVKKKIVEKTAE